MSPVQLFVGVPLALFGLALIAFAVMNARRASAAAAWPSVPGTILVSRLTSGEVSSGDDSSTTRYDVKLEYEYAVDGQTHRGKRLAFGSVGSTDRAAVERHLTRYPEGAKVEVFYDPRDPKAAVLEKRASGQNLMAIVMGVVVIATGVAVTLFLGG